MRNILLVLLMASPVLAADRPAVFTDDDFNRHVDEVRKRLPSKDFTIIIEKPFVVIGDESARAVQGHSVSTVRWAVKRLKESYFDKDPNQILDVWLFKDKASYDKHVKLLWDEEPVSPYGYYSSAHRALIMNISTGGGTLVHEIVHPFIEANFPRCPSWLNEGLGSLYEQSSEREQQIVGLTNWRLAGLQKAIKAGSVPAFKDLTATNPFQFYSRDKGTNYAQARYLCYYLQEKGLLRKFYKDFVAGHEKDPTGFETLKKTLGVEDMEAFKKEWEGFVMRLKFP
jgi:hypothetical protein